MRTVDEALNKILAEYVEFDKRHHNKIQDCYLVTIQKLAKAMHAQYWKYRKEILEKIHEWVQNHPKEWKDNEGRIWKIGYGQLMYPFYGYFDLKKVYDILELIRTTEVIKNERI